LCGLDDVVTLNFVNDEPSPPTESSSHPGNRFLTPSFSFLYIADIMPPRTSTLAKSKMTPNWLSILSTSLHGLITSHHMSPMTSLPLLITSLPLSIPFFPKFITCAVLFPVSDAMPSHRPFNVPVDNLTPLIMACVCLPLNTRDPLGR